MVNQTIPAHQIGIITQVPHQYTARQTSLAAWNHATGNNSKRNNVTCIFCWIPGHRQEECWKRIKENEPCLDSNGRPFWPITCSFCWLPGHCQEECWKRIKLNEPCLDLNGKPFWPPVPNTMEHQNNALQAQQDNLVFPSGA
jgi:hypothetical protein